MFLLLLGLYITEIYCTTPDYENAYKSRLIALFLDGLRWDYLQNDSLSGMRQLSAFGVSIPRLKPIFPSDCHANIHALFAGRRQSHPEFFNEKFEQNFSSPDLLWHEVVRQGKRSQLYSFPFCKDPELLGENINSSSFDCFNSSHPNTQSLSATMQQVLSAMDDSRSVDFAGVYYGELDRIAHLHGPSSSQLRTGPIAEIDAVVLQTLNALVERPSLANVNLVIVADHGMTEFKQFIYLDRLFKWSMVVRTVNLGTTVALWPEPDMEKELLETLSAVPHTRVFTPSTWPEAEWGPSPPPPILLVADAGFAFESKYHQPVHRHVFRPEDNPRGYHGYPPDVTDMHTALYAFGPDFPPQSQIVAGISSTHNVHQVLSQVLGLSPVYASSPQVAMVESGMQLWEPRFVYLLVVIAILLCCVFTAVVCFFVRKKQGYSQQIDLEDEDENEKI